MMHKIEQDTCDREFEILSAKFKDALIVMMFLAIVAILAYYNLGLDSAYQDDNTRIERFESYLAQDRFGIGTAYVTDNMTWSQIRASYYRYRNHPGANMVLNRYFNDFCGDGGSQ